MSTIDKNLDYFSEQIDVIKTYLSNAMGISFDDIKVSFPSLKSFTVSNDLYKSSWAIYILKDEKPLLFYSGNFLIQGSKYSARSSKSPFGVKCLSGLSSIACTFSTQASMFKQNWAMDLNIDGVNAEDKLKLSVSEYKDFLSVLNQFRAHWLLLLSEEANLDFVVGEFSEPLSQSLFLDINNLSSAANKTKTFFKPISSSAIATFLGISKGTEFEGRFYNLQPDSWIRDDVLIEMENVNFKTTDKPVMPFVVHAVKPT